jgi:hypothetical protein
MSTKPRLRERNSSHPEAKEIRFALFTCVFFYFIVLFQVLLLGFLYLFCLFSWFLDFLLSFRAQLFTARVACECSLSDSCLWFRLWGWAVLRRGCPQVPLPDVDSSSDANNGGHDESRHNYTITQLAISMTETTIVSGQLPALF